MTNDIYKELHNLSPEKRELLQLLLKEQGIDLSHRFIVPQSRDAEYFPLSFAQQRLWFLNELEPGSPLYNNSTAVRLTGPLDISALQQSLNEIVRRHEILRTTFATVDGQPVQRISPELKLTLPVEDLTSNPVARQKAEVSRLATEEAQRPFDLSTGPLLRVKLLRLDEQEHVVLLTMHHIVSDGWSIGVFIREVAALYEAFVNGRPSPLPELPIQYVDFAVWQRQWLQGEIRDKQLSYWKEQLSGSPNVLDLPTDRPRPSFQTYHGAFQTFTLSQKLRAGLEDLSRKEDATLFMTLLAAFQTLLYRYSAQDDLNVGSPIANRNRAEVEGLIGFFVNTLVLRGDLSGNPTFRQLLSRVREVTLQAYAHQDLPFEMLVEELRPQRDMSHSPLFQVMFVLNNTPMQAIELSGLTMSFIDVDNGTAKFDIVLSVTEETDCLRGKLEYNTDLFDASTIERMVQHYQMILEGIVADPDRRVSDLPLLTSSQRHQLLREWNDPATDLSHPSCIHELIEAQAERSPDAVAVVFEDQRLTYGELDQRANQLAHHLRRLGVGPEVPVGLCAERCPEMIVGLLGILKAGAAYLPLDPTYPKERLAFMMKDARVPVLLTQRALVERLPEHNARVIYLDPDWEGFDSKSSESPSNVVAAENVAYVIYTSGSTGQPKGVLVSHGTIAKHCAEILEYYELTPKDHVLQFAALNFDASLEQILPTLVAGACLVLRDTDVWAVSEFRQKVVDLGLTVINLPTPYWHQLAEEWAKSPDQVPADQLRLVIVGGDRMSMEALRLWHQTPMRSVRLLNAYGPTEATITATTFDVPAKYSEESTANRIPIGRPLLNRNAYLLDSEGNPVPVGVPGELYLGGAGLARGYLNRPDLTAEKFLPDPFSELPGARLYRTGDLGRYLPDGQIEFLGRVDNQVKVRGFRIELGDVESALRQHPHLEDVVVVARDDNAESKRLVAYVVADRETKPTVSELRSFLGERLPDYMIPSAFVMLDRLPQTPSGKIDRRALPEPTEERPELEAAYVAPRTPVEETLADIVGQVLGVDRVGIRDNFFELGGHSMLAIQVISQVRELFQVDVPLRSLFESPTVEGLAVAIARTQAEVEDREKLEQMLSELEQLSEEEVKTLLTEDLTSGDRS